MSQFLETANVSGCEAPQFTFNWMSMSIWEDSLCLNHISFVGSGQLVTVCANESLFWRNNHIFMYLYTSLTSYMCSYIRSTARNKVWKLKDIKRKAIRWTRKYAPNWRQIPSLKLTFPPLKMDGWKMSFLLGPGLFSGAMFVSFRECIILPIFKPLKFTHPFSPWALHLHRCLSSKAHLQKIHSHCVYTMIFFKIFPSKFLVGCSTQVYILLKGVPLINLWRFFVTAPRRGVQETGSHGVRGLTGFFLFYWRGGNHLQGIKKFSKGMILGNFLEGTLVI